MYVPVKEIGPMPQFECEVWWRADIKTYANFDLWSDGDYTGSHDVIELTPYEVLYHTPKGVCVRSFMGPKCFVRGSAIKQVCVPTKKLALQDLVARKRLHAEMAQKRADKAAAQHVAVQRALEIEDALDHNMVDTEIDE